MRAALLNGFCDANGTFHFVEKTDTQASTEKTDHRDAFRYSQVKFGDRFNEDLLRQSMAFDIRSS